jgi:hypothetical protein
VKIGSKVVRRGRYGIFQMTEVAVPKELFQEARKECWQLPSRSETGFCRIFRQCRKRANLESSAWFGFLALQGIPATIVEKLNIAMVMGLDGPQFEQAHDRSRRGPSPTSPAQFKAFIAAGVAKWRKVIEVAGVAKVDQ